MQLSIIIPAKNEVQNIEATVRSVFDYCYRKNIEHEILVVTNKSTDGTPQIVHNLAKHIPSLRLLDYPRTGGKGFAVREGMLHATGQYRLFMDADNSTTIDNYERFLPWFEKGYDVVIASIRTPGAQVIAGSEPFYRILFGRLSGIYTQLIILPGIGDTQRGFKIFSARAAQDIFPRQRITQFGFDIEVLALARRYKYKIKEMPVRWHNDPNTASHPRFSSYFQVLKDTFHIKWDLLTGKYDREAPTPLLSEKRETAN